MHIETRYLLNIGLRSADGRCQITPGAAIHELYGALDQSPVKLLGTSAHISSTERTLVVELSATPSWWAIYDLSTTLWQDCIAAYDLEIEEGELIGPRAAKWGAFDPTQFLLPNGLRLAGKLPEPVDVCTVPHYYAPAKTVVKWVETGPYAGQPFKNAQPNPLSAETADFSDFGDCNKLATLGVFAIDKASFKQRRALEREAAGRIAGAYHWIGLNRRAELSRIQSDVADLLPEGIWPTSSRLYTERRDALDHHVMKQAEKAGYCS